MWANLVVVVKWQLPTLGPACINQSYPYGDAAWNVTSRKWHAYPAHRGLQTWVRGDGGCQVDVGELVFASDWWIVTRQMSGLPLAIAQASRLVTGIPGNRLTPYIFSIPRDASPQVGYNLATPSLLGCRTPHCRNLRPGMGRTAIPGQQSSSSTERVIALKG